MNFTSLHYAVKIGRIMIPSTNKIKVFTGNLIRKGLFSVGEEEPFIKQLLLESNVILSSYLDLEENIQDTLEWKTFIKGKETETV